MIEVAKNNQLVVVENAKIDVQSSKYKAIYPDMIQVIIRNLSEKTIKSMEVGSLGYDRNGYPVKIPVKYVDSEYEFVGNGTDVNIVAGEVFGEDVGWPLYEFTVFQQFYLV